MQRRSLLRALILPLLPAPLWAPAVRAATLFAGSTAAGRIYDGDIWIEPSTGELSIFVSGRWVRCEGGSD